MLKSKKSSFTLGLLKIFDICFGIFFLPLLLAERICSYRHNRNFKKILIIEIWGIGDVCIMSGILRDLRLAFPGSSISLLSKPHAELILGHSGLIDNFIKISLPWTNFNGKYRFWAWDWEGILKVITHLRREKFDLCFDARGDFRNNLLAFIIGAKRRVGFAWTGGRYLLTDAVEFDYQKRQRILAWSALLNRIGVKAGPPKPCLRPSGKLLKEAEKILELHAVRDEDLLVGIHPGAGARIRCWPMDRFAKVAESIRDNYKAKIIVFIGPDEYESDIVIRGPFIKLKLPLDLFTATASMLDLFICNDGGPMHIADALGIQVVAIFGPGSIDWFGPYSKNSKALFRKDVACRPCFDNCRQNAPFCLNEISVDDVLKAAEEKIKINAV